MSADEATRGEGGELGTFPRGRMMPSFDEVAFALEVGKPSGPVKTDRGVHLILVESHDAASQTPFEEVAEKLATEILRDDRAGEAARNAANQVIEKTSAGEPFVKAAESVKLPVTITPPFSFKDAQVPGLAGVPDLREAAFALSEEHPVARRVFADPENLYVIALQTREEPSEEQIASEMSSMREKLQQRERGITTGVWFNDAAEGARSRREGPAVRDHGRALTGSACYGIGAAGSGGAGHARERAGRALRTRRLAVQGPPLDQVGARDEQPPPRPDRRSRTGGCRPCRSGRGCGSSRSLARHCVRSALLTNSPATPGNLPSHLFP